MQKGTPPLLSPEQQQELDDAWVELWSQEEHRIGLKPILRRV